VSARSSFASRKTIARPIYCVDLHSMDTCSGAPVHRRDRKSEYQAF
jgi:hypothetical protein